MLGDSVGVGNNKSRAVCATLLKGEKQVEVAAWVLGYWSGLNANYPFNSVGRAHGEKRCFRRSSKIVLLEAEAGIRLHHISYLRPSSVCASG